MKENKSLMTAQQHFQELRKRIIFSLIFFVIFFTLSYFFSQKIYNFLLHPFVDISQNNINRKIIYTSPAEAFITYLKLSFYSALFFSMPIFISQIYLFLSPALYKNEKKNIFFLFFSSPFLFFCGAVFAYFLVLPQALKFFASFEYHGLASNTNFTIQLEMDKLQAIKFQRIRCF
jgi:sec-independent protein translocase protein TatC